LLTPARPHQDHGRLTICSPPPGRLEGLQLVDPADEGRARHAAAHLAGIIPRDRLKGNSARKEPATQRWGTSTRRRMAGGGFAGACRSAILSSGQVMRPDPNGKHMARLTVGAGSPMTTGPHRSLPEHLQGLIERKRFLCANEPAWERRAPRDREIAALNRQIYQLLDHWLLRRLPKSSTSALQSSAVEPSPQLTERH